MDTQDLSPVEQLEAEVQSLEDIARILKDVALDLHEHSESHPSLRGYASTVSAVARNVEFIAKL